jgi:hypothetical protein
MMSNQNAYTQELLNRIMNRYSVDSVDMPMGDWLRQNTSLNGRPFSFDRYPFQEAIANDMHTNMDVVKPSQVGLSEVQVRKSLGFVARNRGTTLIFTMPNEKMFKRMSTTRIKPLVDEEKAFNLETRSGEKPARSKDLYQIGQSFMHVTGASESDATSIPADVVMNDEIDLTDQQMLALFNSRLQNSDWKINQRFSTPTFTGFGVDKGFQVSDQHEYMKKCSACNHWQVPIFRPEFVHIPNLPDDINSLMDIDEQMIDDRNLDLLNSYVKCEKCHAPLDLSTDREWVPKYASRSHARGYRVGPFSTSRLPISYVVSQLLRYKARDHLRGWHNTVLGESYTDSNARMSDADIDKCFTGRMDVPDVDASAPTWIGIDIGQTCHLLVGQGNSDEDMHVIRFEEIPISELKDVVQGHLDTYNVVGGAVDRFPYTPNADELWSISNGRILPVEYRGQKTVNLVKDPSVDDDVVVYAQMNRTQFLDKVAARVRRKRILFSGYGSQQALIREHLKDMVRDEDPEKEAKWVKLNGNDHYFHGMGFLLAAPKLKETQNYLFTEPRGSVSIGGVSMGAAPSSLLGNGKKSGLV